MIWIKKITAHRGPLDAYYGNVFLPFVGNTILGCNNCEHVLACTFAALRLPYVRVTLGGKINTMTKKKRAIFDALVGKTSLDAMLSGLAEVNGYFQLAKHAHVEFPVDFDKNLVALEPGFDWDQVDLLLRDVSTLDRVTVTGQMRRASLARIFEVRDSLFPLKERAERWRMNDDASRAQLPQGRQPERVSRT